MCCEPERTLYLAVPVETYETFFRRETVREMTQAYRLAQELVSLGVPKEDIVLGFYSPFMRQFTDYAVS